MSKFNDIARDIINTRIYKKMKGYIQHGNTSCYKHCIEVSYKSYIVSKKLNKIFNLNLDEKSIIRASLLHDFFLYDWHYLPKEKNLFKKHGFTHPEIALKNAKKYFDINNLEEDIILNHMWPLTFYRFPKYKETYMVLLIDKYCTLNEIVHNLLTKQILIDKLQN